jgi:hypothetical protein
MHLQYQQPSELLAHFRQIPANQHFAIIRFFEQNTPVLGNLPIRDYVILLSFYVDALYEEGGFDAQVLSNTEELLELSIIHNVQYVDGQDIYLRTLLQRAVAFIHLGKIAEATHLAKQLLRLAPEQKVCRQLLHDCLMMQRPNWVQQAWAGAILVVLVAMLLSFTEILLPQSWHDVAASTLNTLSLAGFAGAISLLLAGVVGHHYYVRRQIRRNVLGASK